MKTPSAAAKALAALRKPKNMKRGDSAYYRALVAKRKDRPPSK